MHALNPIQAIQAAPSMGFNHKKEIPLGNLLQPGARSFNPDWNVRPQEYSENTPITYTQDPITRNNMAEGRLIIQQFENPVVSNTNEISRSKSSLELGRSQPINRNAISSKDKLPIQQQEGQATECSFRAIYFNQPEKKEDSYIERDEKNKKIKSEQPVDNEGEYYQTSAFGRYRERSSELAEKMEEYRKGQQHIKKLQLDEEIEDQRKREDEMNRLRYQRIDRLDSMQFGVDKQNLKKLILFFETDKFWELLILCGSEKEFVSTTFLYQLLVVVIDQNSYELLAATQIIDVLCEKQFSCTNRALSTGYLQEKNNRLLSSIQEIIESIRSSIDFLKNKDIFKVTNSIHYNTPRAQSFLTKPRDQLDWTNQNKQKENIEPSIIVSDVSKLTSNSRLSILQSSMNSSGNSYPSQQSRGSSSQDKNIGVQSQIQSTLNFRQKARASYLNSSSVFDRLYNDSYQDARQSLLLSRQLMNEIIEDKPKSNNSFLQRSLSKTQQSLERSKSPTPSQSMIISQTLNPRRSYSKSNLTPPKANSSINSQRQSKVSPQKFITPEKRMSISPNRTVSNQSQPKQVLLYVNINISKGKTGRIAYYQGDSPESTASHFAKQNNLSPEAEAKLLDKLKSVLINYYSTIYSGKK